MKKENSQVCLHVGQRRHGFLVKRLEQIAEIRVTAYELIHEVTGAQVLHLHCADPENLFAVAFRTPPPDSTGVPHILEHAVLAGSRRYPLKDVFNELMKGSLKTFINAFTYPDKTIYPVASQNRTDFFNLARVYCDLVFRPRLLKETFWQEGHHLEFADLENIDGDLIISGIVYNEMLGAYSSPDTLMYKAIQEGLFFDHPYAFDSGGNPEVIPSLTYEMLREFHRTYYSPTNARFFLYGNISTEDHLLLLQEVLEGFDRVEINSSIPRQKRRDEPLISTSFYPLGREEPLEDKTIVNQAWLLAENTDYENALLLEILSAALVGNAASPLRKALIDSGLGQDLSPVTGLERDLRQLVFAVGLRGCNADCAGAIADIISNTLHKIYQEGFERELIEGVMHQVEFHGREIVRGAYPYGIVLMGRVFHFWLYDGDPLMGLNLPRQMEAMRRRWEQNPRLFADAVKTWFLDNGHRVLSIMQPSHSLQEEVEAARKREMAARKASLSGTEREKIRQEALELRRYQAEEDPPQAAACLPRLSLKEISPQADRIPVSCGEKTGVPVLSHDIFSNGIAYLDLAFDIGDLPEDLYPYLPLLGKLTLNMGAGRYNYEEMAKRIALTVGGISYHLNAGTIMVPAANNAAVGELWQKFILRVKFLYRNTEAALEILADLLCDGDLSHQERMTELIREKRNDLHAAVVPSGHIFARRSAAAGLHPCSFRDEQWHGRTQLRFLNEIAKTLPSGTAEIADKMAQLRGLVYGRKRLLINITADREGLDLLDRKLDALLTRLPAGVVSDGGFGAAIVWPSRQGICLPSQVSYVAQSFAVPPFSDSRSAYLTIIERFLATGYLYQKIRVQGGAYGAMCVYDPGNGILSFLSYRDPHILETLQVYREALDYISHNLIEPEELQKAIIGTIAGLDRPSDPAGRGYTSLIRYLCGLTDEARDKFRRRILEATPEELREAAVSCLTGAANRANIAIYGSQLELNKSRPFLEGLVVESLL